MTDENKVDVAIVGAGLAGLACAWKLAGEGLSVLVLERGDAPFPLRSRQVRQRRKEVAHLAREVATHGIDRLTADEPNRLRTYTREMEVVEILDSVFSTVRRIARTVG